MKNKILVFTALLSFVPWLAASEFKAPAPLTQARTHIIKIAPLLELHSLEILETQVRNVVLQKRQLSALLKAEQQPSTELVASFYEELENLVNMWGELYSFIQQASSEIKKAYNADERLRLVGTLIAKLHGNC